MDAVRRGGIVIGRFMPPHAGHEYLIRFARAFTPHLSVFLCSLSTEPIPGSLRYEWMARLFPDVRLVHLTEEIPGAARSQPGAHTIWASAIRDRIDVDPQYVFASEDYGLELAEALGAEFVPVDPHRTVFPVSAEMIRNDPFGHWRFIPGVVRPYFARKLVVHDSLGMLAAELAKAYGTVAATNYPAFTRTAADSVRNGSIIRNAADLASAQAASEEALLLHANRVLLSPTDPVRILCSAGLPAADRDAVMERLLAAHRHLAPSLVVAVEPVDETYRDALETYGWPYAAAADRETARARCVGQIDEWLSRAG